MNSRSNLQDGAAENTPTFFVAATPTADRDVAGIRSVKRSLLAQLQADSTEPSPTPEQLLAQWPTDPKADPDAASIVFQDFCQRRAKDAKTKIKEYEDRFPEYKETLALLEQKEALLKSLSPASGPGSSSTQFALPEVGDRLFGFRLLHELGRGSFARVFLASQDDLASRPVVLKVSNLEGDEPQTMAMLQHTHIVPIHSVHEDKRAGLRGVCMPYFGGASLSAVLKEAGVGRVTVHSGTELVRALKAVQAPVSVAEPGGAKQTMVGDPKVLSLLEGLQYPQAAAWIVARLAEGLQHSHSRGVLHRDIKPSNVLVGMDGQPMLLDFNLAQLTRGDQVRVVLGGTINYMAPEHLRSIAARDLTLARKVDHRADIYSLGMVLFEMLVGRSPFAESATYTPIPRLVEAMALERGGAVPSLRQSLPDAPWNLESIIRKCLAPLAADRYQQAEHLAEDLQRFLDDRPLRYAPELSLRERCRKWRRRHPRVTTAGTVGAAAAFLLAMLGGALIGSHQLLATTQSHLNETRENLDRTEAQERKRAFQAGTIRALCLVNTTTDGKDQLKSGRAACAETLGLYQILARDDWQQQFAWQYLDEADRRQLAEDARELVLLLAFAEAESAPDNSACRRALALLDRGEAIGGLPPLRALWEDRARYFERLGEPERANAARAKAAEITPASVRDFYLLATSYERMGRHADAIAELNKGLRLKPNHYWSLVQRGICYRNQGERLLAAGDFGRCAGIEPDFALGHYNLGCILDQSDKREEAVASYTAALRCDKGFALAYLNRGASLLNLKQFQAALDDWDHAAALGRDDALLHLGRGTALESLQKSKQANVAFALALDRLPALPADQQARLLSDYGFAVCRRLPDAADRAFMDALRQEPRNQRALYGKAMLFAEAGKEADAIVWFDEALKWHPSFLDARRSRAVLLARIGKLTLAQEEINLCLRQDGAAGITLYKAACILALAAERSSDNAIRREREDQALSFLAQANQQGYGLAGAATDADLRALRHRKDFQTLLAKENARSEKQMPH
jgi:eukaryotic-like serine/threonine-protein kinase